MKPALETILLGQTKVAEIERRLAKELEVDVVVGPKTGRRTKATFADIGGKGTRKPFVIKMRSTKLKTICDRFRESFGGQVELRFIDPITGKGVANNSITLKKLQQEYLPDEQREWLKTLEQSPLFHFSLASKELFHSNFLYWLGTNETAIFKKLVRNWINWPGRGEVEKILCVKREKKYLDLVIEYLKSNASADDVSTLVLENKVKSIPTVQQLKDYGARKEFKDNKKVQFILLTLCPLKQILPDKWRQCSYSSYLELLKSLESLSPNPYHRQLIMDYCDFTAALCKLVGSVKDDEQYFLKGELDRRARELRIHDLLLKFQANCLAEILLDRLPSSVKLISWARIKAGQTTVEENYLRGTAICSVFYHFNKNIFAGVQLDGKHLRLAVRAPDDFAEDLALNFWNDQNDWWGLGDEIGKFKSASRDYKSRINKSGFLEYKGKEEKAGKSLFLYRHLPLLNTGQSMSISDVAKLIVERFQAMMNNQQAIEQWIANK